MLRDRHRHVGFFHYNTLVSRQPHLWASSTENEQHRKHSPKHSANTMRSTFSTSLFRQATSRRASPSFATRRFASTTQTSQGASNSKQVQDALGAAQRLLASAGRVLGPLGERAAGLLGCAYHSFLPSCSGLTKLYYFGFALCIYLASPMFPLHFHASSSSVLDLRLARIAYRQPLIYNAEVARELLKQIYIAERLQPPTSFATITDAYSVLWSRAKNPQYWRDLLTTGEWARVAVYAVEAYTIFKVGLFSICAFFSLGFSLSFSILLVLWYLLGVRTDWRDDGSKAFNRVQTALEDRHCPTRVLLTRATLATAP